MSKSKAKTVNPISTEAVVKGRKVKVMYRTSEITNRTNKDLWITYPAGRVSEGIVLSSSLTRDEARNAARLMFGQPIQTIRSQRVKTYRASL